MSKTDVNRSTAYYALLRITRDQAYANLELNNQIDRNRPDAPAFVRELVYTVLRNRNYLDFLLAQMVSRGFQKLRPQPLTLLRMGLAQILYMDSVPDHAAVNETVRLARKHCVHQAGMINGVLRTYLRQADTLRKPDSIRNVEERLSICYSVDRSIAALWIDQYGPQKAESMLQACHRLPPLTVRVNTTRIEPAELSERLAAQHIQAAAKALSPRLLELSGRDILDSTEYREGLFSPQGTGSLMAIDALGASPGDTLIDVCAAPGGKSLAAAESMGNKGRILAMDLYENKLREIQRQSGRLGLSIIETVVHDGTKAIDAFAGTADKVICDVPCSGLGVLRKKPEIRYRAVENQGRALAEKQLAILEAASTYLKPGGTLLYSTCTVNRVENQEVTKAFLKEHSSFRVLREEQLLPDEEPEDGFYYCTMRLE